MLLRSLFFATFCQYLIFALENTSILKSVSVVFRHGDRLPNHYPIGFYPNDPYLNYSFLPLNPGDLTNLGKKRMFDFGTMLRNRYNELLGVDYKHSDVFAISTDSVRTKMSLLLTLAGLYPPKNKQVWNDGLNWQPIPFAYMPNEFSTFNEPDRCPKFDKELKRVTSTPEYKQGISRFHDLMKNLTLLTGRKIEVAEDIALIYQTLDGEQLMNLALPEWTKDYFPDKFVDPILFYINHFSFNAQLRKLNGGIVLRKIVNNMIENNSGKVHRNRKIHLFSGHDTNVAGLLKALKIWKDDYLPYYSSAIIIELHEVNSTDYIKILYHTGILSKIEEQTVPGCTKLCPLKTFLELYKDVMPDNILEACYGPPSDSLLTPKNVDKTAWFYRKLDEWFNV